MRRYSRSVLIRIIIEVTRRSIAVGVIALHSIAVGYLTEIALHDPAAGTAQILVQCQLHGLYVIHDIVELSDAPGSAEVILPSAGRGYISEGLSGLLLLGLALAGCWVGSVYGKHGPHECEPIQAFNRAISLKIIKPLVDLVSGNYPGALVLQRTIGFDLNEKKGATVFLDHVDNERCQNGIIDSLIFGSSTRAPLWRDGIPIANAKDSGEDGVDGRIPGIFVSLPEIDFAQLVQCQSVISPYNFRINFCCDLRTQPGQRWL